ncbi:unnamed protein product, partial [Heterosigma akashiwo]
MMVGQERSPFSQPVAVRVGQCPRLLKRGVVPMMVVMSRTSTSITRTSPRTRDRQRAYSRRSRRRQNPSATAGRRWRRQSTSARSSQNWRSQGPSGSGCPSGPRRCPRGLRRRPR